MLERPHAYRELIVRSDNCYSNSNNIASITSYKSWPFSIDWVWYPTVRSWVWVWICLQMIILVN